jgi:hypothetical protein
LVNVIVVPLTLAVTNEDAVIADVAYDDVAAFNEFILICCEAELAFSCVIELLVDEVNVLNSASVVKLPVSKLSTKVSIIFPLYDLSISGVIACVLLSANDALLSACNCAFVSIAIYGFYSF